MPRSRKVMTVVDQENKKPEKVASISKKKSNKKDIKNTNGTLSGDQLKVVKIILNAQSSDANSKKCLPDLSKLYTTVSIGFGGSGEI